MAMPWEEYQQQEQGPWADYAQAPETTPAVTMQQAGSRQLPPLWDANVGGVPVRGVFDADAKAYLVGNRQGQAFYIAKDPQGELTLKPYTGKPSAAGTGRENFWAGFGKAAVDTKRGIQQLGALAGNTLGLVDDSTVDQTFANAKEMRERDADLMGTGAGKAGNFSGSVATAYLGGSLVRGAGQGVGHIGKGMAASSPSLSVPVSYAGNAISKAGQAVAAPTSFKQAAAAGAAIGASQPATSGAEKSLQAGVGAAGGVAGQGISKGVSSLARGAKSLRPEVKDLATIARDKWGINVRNDQLVDSPKLNAVASVLEETAGTGATAAKENQQKQFNIALARTIGEASDNPLYAMNQAQKRLSKAFEDTLQNNRVLVDDEFVSGMGEVVRQANKNLKPSEAGIIRNQVDDILSKVDADGRVDGQALYNIKRDLDQIGGRNSNEAIHAIDLKKELLAALNRSLGPDDAAKFTKVRTQYKNLLDLQKLKNRDAAGDISPARLGNSRAEFTDDLEELAAIAKTFLAPKTGNSGTAVRMRSDTNILNIPVRAGELAGGLTVGRLLNAGLESPAIGRVLMEGSRKARAIEPASRAAPLVLPAFLESYLTSR